MNTTMAKNFLSQDANFTGSDGDSLFLNEQQQIRSLRADVVFYFFLKKR